jgi:hypothetical protein
MAGLGYLGWPPRHGNVVSYHCYEIGARSGAGAMIRLG